MKNRRTAGLLGSRSVAVVLACAGLLAASPSAAQIRIANGGEMVQLDFNDVELAVVIDAIARITGKNFIYDDRVRGRVTIVSPTKVNLEQAYAVFESVLQVKGFTTVEGPGGVLKIIPVRDAKESSIETVMDARPSPNRDTFVTRLIPLRYIDAESITNTIKPLVSKDAAMVAYAPTNTIILTDTSANIRRLLSILDAIDIETYKESLAVIQIKHADAATLGRQISEIYGAEVAAAGRTPAARRARGQRRGARATAAVTSVGGRRKARIITDERTNSLIVLASRGQLDEIRELVHKLDIPVVGGGKIRVYYLKHADAEELAQTLNGLVSGQGVPSAPAGPGGGAAQALRAAVTELAGGVSLTADPATNSLVIQASKEAYETLAEVIAKLDIARPQVLVEALFMEVDVTDTSDLGFNALLRITRGWDIAVRSATDSTTRGGLDIQDAVVSGAASALLPGSGPFAASVVRETIGGNVIAAILRASATDGNTNVLSAPHILTSDNEEAEIRIGNNIPIVTSRVNAATGVSDALSSSVNVERQDIGVTLRVTPQISEGDSLRLKIFQEITDVNEALSAETGDPAEVGVSLTSRRIENTLVVADGETVVVGGLISEGVQDTVSRVPWLGSIPILGWAFKTKTRTVKKVNLLIFLTPHIIRNASDLASQTIRKRKEFRENAGGRLDLSKAERKEADALGIDYSSYAGGDAVRNALVEHSKRYPLQRMREIEDERERIREEKAEAAKIGPEGTRYGVRADVFSDPDAASAALTEILDAGYEGTLVSGETDGMLLFEVQVGPFETLEEAEQASEVLQEVFGYSPSLIVLPTNRETPVEDRELAP